MIMTKKRPSLADLTRSKKTQPNKPSSDEPPPIKPMTLRLPKSTWKDLKLRTIDEERSMHAIILDAIALYLEKNSGAKQEL